MHTLEFKEKAVNKKKSCNEKNNRNIINEMDNKIRKSAEKWYRVESGVKFQRVSHISSVPASPHPRVSY
jgi:hypothetical protein